MRLLHPGDPWCVSCSLLDRKGSDLDLLTRPLATSATCAGARATWKILDAVDLLGGVVEDRELEPLGAVLGTEQRYALRASTSRWGEKPDVDDLRPPDRASNSRRSRGEHRGCAAVPGVVRVFTAADVPGVGLIHKHWPVFIPRVTRTSYISAMCAAFVAADRVDGPARLGRLLVDVEYEVLRPLTDVVTASRTTRTRSWELDGNVLGVRLYGEHRRGGRSQRGRRAGFDSIEHAFLEPDVMPEADGRLKMYSAARASRTCPSSASTRSTSWPSSRPTGGAFGGKEGHGESGADPSVTVAGEVHAVAVKSCCRSTERTPSALISPSVRHRGKAHAVCTAIPAVRVGGHEGA